jgi:hypothetical protein
MMFYFTPLEGIMLHHQGRNIFRPLGMYSSSSSHPDGTLFESPIRWRGKKRKLSPAVRGGGLPGCNGCVWEGTVTQSSAGCVKREREGVCVKIHSTPPLYISSCCCVEWGERKQTEVFYYCQENVNLNVKWSKWHRQDTHSPHEKDFDGSVRPTGGLRLWYLLAHPLCRSGKAWNPTVIKGGSFPKDLRR